jgi:predicted GNAT superfamily acetyltransferase
MKNSHQQLSIEIRHCKDIKDFEGCVEIQRRTWGGDQVVPVPIFVVAAHTGGQVLGAFDKDRLIGFALALTGVRNGYYLHSHMAAVLPDLRNRGIGKRLKVAQREDALARGIERMEWTFDPLEANKAYFNLTKLGAVSRRLIPNCYGVTQSPLHHGLPTHRLVAEWWLASKRVSSVLSGVSKGAPLPNLLKRVALPKDWDRLRVTNRNLAAKVQSVVRRALERLFADGYVAVGLERKDGKAEYLLASANEIVGLKIPASRNVGPGDEIKE